MCVSVWGNEAKEKVLQQDHAEFPAAQVSQSPLGPWPAECRVWFSLFSGLLLEQFFVWRLKPTGLLVLSFPWGQGRRRKEAGRGRERDWVEELEEGRGKTQ